MDRLHLESDPVAVIVVDKDGKLAKLCSRAETLFQRGREAIGLPLSALLSLTYKEISESCLEHQKHKEQKHANCCTSSIVGYRRDCTSFPCELCIYDGSTEEKDEEMVGVDKTMRRHFETYRRLRDAVDQERGIKKIGLTFLIRDLSVCFSDFPRLPPSRYRSDFEELETLGRGSFGSVFACRHKLENKVYAIKKIQLRKQAHLELTSSEEEDTLRFDGADHSSGSKTQDLQKTQSMDLSKQDTGSKDKDKKKKKSLILLRSHQPQASLMVHRKLIETKVLAQIESHPNVIRYYGSWIEQEFVLSSSVRSCLFGDKDEFLALGKKRISEPPKGAVKLSYVLHIQMQLCATRGYKGGPVLQNSLESWLAYCDEHDPIDPNQNLAIFVQIIRGLHHIHASGFIHRDIKPGNILIIKNDAVEYGGDDERRRSLERDTTKRYDEEDVPVKYPTTGEQRKDKAVKDAGFLLKIGDFGLATKEIREIDSGDSLTTGDTTDTKNSNAKTSGIGTVLYSAPEQLSSTTYDRKADVFCLGLILVELFTKFQNKKQRHKAIREARSGKLPLAMLESYPTVAELAKELLSEDPTKRPTTSQLLKHMLLLPFNRKYRLHPGVASVGSPRYQASSLLQVAVPMLSRRASCPLVEEVPPASPFARARLGSGVLSATTSPRISTRGISPQNSPLMRPKKLTLATSPSQLDRKTPDEEESIAGSEDCPSPRRRLSGESELAIETEFPSSVSEEDMGETSRQAFPVGFCIHPERDRALSASLRSSRRSIDRRVCDSLSSIATTVSSSPQVRFRTLTAHRGSGTTPNTTPGQSSHRLGLGRRSGPMDSCSKCLELEIQITQLKEGELGLQKHLEVCKHNLQLRDTELEKQEKLITLLQAKLKEHETQLAERDATIYLLRKNLRAEKEKGIYGTPTRGGRNLNFGAQYWPTSPQMHHTQLQPPTAQHQPIDLDKNEI